MVENLRVTQETWVQSLGQEDPLEKAKPLQYSCLENPMDGGAWWATVHEVAKSRTRLGRLSRHSKMLSKEAAAHGYNGILLSDKKEQI